MKGDGLGGWFSGGGCLFFHFPLGCYLSVVAVVVCVQKGCVVAYERSSIIVVEVVDGSSSGVVVVVVDDVLQKLLLLLLFVVEHEEGGILGDEVVGDGSPGSNDWGCNHRNALRLLLEGGKVNKVVLLRHVDELLQQVDIVNGNDVRTDLHANWLLRLLRAAVNGACGSYLTARSRQQSQRGRFGFLLGGVSCVTYVSGWG